MTGGIGQAAERAALVDREMLDALRAALGPATDGLIVKASSVLEDRLAKLEALAGDPLGDACARLAHEIGGVAGQIGMRRLSQDALALEQLCRAADAAAAKDAAGRIGAVGRDSLAAVKAL